MALESADLELECDPSLQLRYLSKSLSKSLSKVLSKYLSYLSSLLSKCLSRDWSLKFLRKFSSWSWNFVELNEELLLSFK